jgi:cell division protein FtsI (penicillin-binding protein 3)
MRLPLKSHATQVQPARPHRVSLSSEVARSQRLRASAVVVGVGIAFATVAGQLAMLAATGGSDIVLTLNEPIAKSFARPDIVDRGGRLLATDVEMPSLFADPSLIGSPDEAAEQLATALPGLNEPDLRRQLEDRSKRFVWIRRGISPKTAQAVHDLGLPGLSFRDELRRAYPLERLAGHTLGQVNVDNRGVGGIERYIDDTIGVEAVHGATLSSGVPIRLSLDLGAQHSLEDELRQAMSRYEAKGAAGLVMDVETGELLAAASLPGLDPSFPLEARDPDRADRLQSGTYELGSIFKAFTVAMALEGGKTIDTMVDVTQPLTAGRFTITDTHPSGKPLSVADVFIRSSNVGAGMLALMAGEARQREFLEKLGLLDALRTEAGPVAPPQIPQRIGRAEQITISYGHGIAVAPIQVAAAAASLINGGERVSPTFLRRADGASSARTRVVSEATSKNLCELFRRNVTDAHGTGKRADVPGYRVGGKTGTAEMPGRSGGYSEKAVISSFLAAFPMDAPKYLVMISLFEPKGTDETKGEILAGLNAAPTAGRVIARIAPMLGVVPDGALAGLPE